MTETYKIYRYYLITIILVILITIGFCGFFIAKDKSEFMLFGNICVNDTVAKALSLVYNKF